MYLKEVSHVKKLLAVAMIGVGWMLSAATAHAQTTPNLFRSASSFRLDPCVIRMFVNCNGVQFRPSEFRDQRSGQGGKNGSRSGKTLIFSAPSLAGAHF